MNKKNEVWVTEGSKMVSHATCIDLSDELIPAHIEQARTLLLRALLPLVEKNAEVVVTENEDGSHRLTMGVGYFINEVEK
jgi:hypothetical protein